MTKSNTSEVVIIAGTFFSLSILAFLAGYLFTSSPKSQLVVNQAGNLERRIAED